MRDGIIAEVALLVAVGANGPAQIDELMYRLRDVKLGETPGELYSQALGAVRKLHSDLASMGSGAWTYDYKEGTYGATR